MGAAGDAGVDGGEVADAAWPVELAVIEATPPLIGWRRGGQLEVMTFDAATGPGAPRPVGAVGVSDGRFAGRGEAVLYGWSAAGDAWVGPAGERVAAGAAMRGLAIDAGGPVVLVQGDAAGEARLIRLDGPVERRFVVEPDASELIGVGVGADGIGVLTGDWLAGSLWLYRFDAALEPLGRALVCDVGCDRPGARIASGPAVAVAWQAVGQVHLAVEGEARVVGDASRGTALDLRWDGRWVLGWSRPVGAPQGVYLDGEAVALGPVRALGVVDARCVVWLDGPALRWGCRR